jgi:hypothetical protein
MARHRTRRSRKAGAVAPRPKPGTNTRTGSTLLESGQGTFGTEAPMSVSQESAKEFRENEDVRLARATRREASALPGNKFVTPYEDIKTFEVSNPMKKAGRKTRKARKSKKVSRRR